MYIYIYKTHDIHFLYTMNTPAEDRGCTRLDFMAPHTHNPAWLPPAFAAKNELRTFSGTPPARQMPQENAASDTHGYETARYRQ
jgi:hypothetical protein